MKSTTMFGAVIAFLVRMLEVQLPLEVQLDSSAVRHGADGRWTLTVV